MDVLPQICFQKMALLMLTEMPLISGPSFFIPMFCKGVLVPVAWAGVALTSFTALVILIAGCCHANFIRRYYDFLRDGKFSEIVDQFPQ